MSGKNKIRLLQGEIARIVRTVDAAAENYRRFRADFPVDLVEWEKLDQDSRESIQQRARVVYERKKQDQASPGRDRPHDALY